MSPYSCSWAAGTTGYLFVGAGRERAELPRDAVEPLEVPRAREFDLVLVAMPTTVPVRPSPTG